MTGQTQPLTKQSPRLKGIRYSRFSAALPVMASIRIRLAVACAACAISAGVISAIWSVHLGLGFIFLFIAVAAFELEKRNTEILLLPPLCIFGLKALLSSAFGVLLLMYNRPGIVDAGILRSQLIGAITLPLVFCGYLITRGSKSLVPFDVNVLHEREVHTLRLFGWTMLVFQILKTVVGAMTGAADRGFAGEALETNAYGVWTVFYLFQRIDMIGFLLVPLILHRASGFTRFRLAILLGFFFVFAVASGSRGLVVYPALYMIFGWYLFAQVINRNLELYAVVAIPILLVFLAGMHVFRTSGAFYDTRLIDIGARIGAVSEMQNNRLYEESPIAETIGNSLVGVSDSIVYENTPTQVPYAGFAGFGAMLYTWVPHFFWQTKPTLQDANDIVVEYRGESFSRSYNAISLPADLFRRFGYFGIGVGLFGFGLFVGLMWRFTIVLLGKLSQSAGILILFVWVGFLHQAESSTVLQTWWIWSYDIPKNIAFGLLVWFICRIMTKSDPRSKGLIASTAS